MATLAHGARRTMEVVGQVAVLHPLHELADMLEMIQRHGLIFIGQIADDDFFGNFAGGQTARRRLPVLEHGLGQGKFLLGRSYRAGYRHMTKPAVLGIGRFGLGQIVMAPGTVGRRLFGGMTAVAALLAGGTVHGLLKSDKLAFLGPAQGVAFAAGVHGGMMADPAGITVFFVGRMIKGHRRHGDGFGLLPRGAFLIKHDQGGIGLTPLQAGDFPVSAVWRQNPGSA